MEGVVRMKKIKLDIEGMHCASCATNIERSLKKVKGVKDANVALMVKKGYVDAENNVNEEELRNAVKKVGGYEVKGIEYEK